MFNEQAVFFLIKFENEFILHIFMIENIWWWPSEKNEPVQITNKLKLRKMASEKYMRKNGIWILIVKFQYRQIWSVWRLDVVFNDSMIWRKSFGKKQKHSRDILYSYTGRA